jgi:hypothetical protein
MPEVDDLSRSLTVFDQARTLLVVVEMSQTSWLVAGMVPGLERRPLKKLYACVRLYRRLFAFLTVRYFVKRREAWPRELIAMTRRDPAFWLWYPAWAL